MHTCVHAYMHTFMLCVIFVSTCTNSTALLFSIPPISTPAHVAAVCAGVVFRPRPSRPAVPIRLVEAVGDLNRPGGKVTAVKEHS